MLLKVEINEKGVGKRSGLADFLGGHGVIRLKEN